MVIDTMTIEQFIAANRIVSGAYRVDANPNMQDSRDMDHWKVTLRRPKHTMTVYFSMGYAHHGAQPNTAEVLSCVADDAASVQNIDFETWCREYGYNSDSRKAEKTFRACQHSAKRLESFLGGSLFDDLVYNTERA